LLGTSFNSTAVSITSTEALASPGRQSPKRQHKRTKSLEGQFHYSSSSASLLTGGGKAERDSQDDDRKFPAYQPDKESLRHSFHGVGLAELELGTIDARILTQH